MALWPSLFLLLLILIDETVELSNTEKEQQAKSLLDNQFHSLDVPPRRWRLIQPPPSDNNNQPPYARYEVRNREYCTGSNLNNAAQICWLVSLHVHSLEKRQFDRVYVFDTSVDPAFMGKVQRINGKSFKDIKPYDIVGQEITNRNGVTRPQCDKYCTTFNPAASTSTTQTKIIIEAKVNRLSVRVSGNELTDIEPKGAMGSKAKWGISCQTIGTDKYCKLKSLKTNKYLRNNNDNSLSVTGSTGGGDRCQWKVTKHRSRWRLKNKQTNKYLCANSNGNRMYAGNFDEAICKFKFFKEN